MRRRAFLAAGASAIACSKAPAPITGRARIAVGGGGQIHGLPATLAQELGFYSDEGLDVIIHDFPDCASALDAVMAGNADIVSGLYDHTIQMAAQGKRLTAFVNMARFPGFVLLVSAKARKPIERLEDLKGTTAGVSARGSSGHFFLNYLLAKRNVAAESVRIKEIGSGASSIDPVESGAVDVAVITEPAIAAISRRSNKLRMLADTRSAEGVREVFGASEFPFSVLYAPPTWIEQNHASTLRLARAVQRALTWMESHTAKQIASKTPVEYRGPDTSLYEDALVESMTMFNPNGVMRPDGVQAVRQALGIAIPSMRTAKIDLAATYTNQFVETP